jgi:hypothetical protein
MVSIPQTMPSPEDFIDKPDSFFKMSLALVKMHSDAFSLSKTESTNRAHIHFEH